MVYVLEIPGTEFSTTVVNEVKKLHHVSLTPSTLERVRQMIAKLRQLTEIGYLTPHAVYYSHGHSSQWFFPKNVSLVISDSTLKNFHGSGSSKIWSSLLNFNPNKHLRVNLVYLGTNP